MIDQIPFQQVLKEVPIIRTNFWKASLFESDVIRKQKKNMSSVGQISLERRESENIYEKGTYSL